MMKLSDIKKTAKQRLLWIKIVTGVTGITFLSVQFFCIYLSGANGRMLWTWTGTDRAALVLLVILALLMFSIVVISIKCFRVAWFQRLVFFPLIILMFLNLAVLLGIPESMVYHLCDLGVRKRVAVCGGLDSLYSWAITMLNTQYHEQYGYVPQERLPASVQCLNADIQIVYSLHEKANILINWGDKLDGRDINHTWGIVIGVPSYETENNRFWWVTQWRPGVYGWHQH